MKNVLDRYPMMKPYVGDKYITGGPKSLLLIGESHYLPEGSTQHLTPESWYSSDSTTLDPTERGWISTSQIIIGSKAANFKNRAHSIYKRAFVEINTNGPKYPDYKDVADEIVYYNYFQRPALYRKSLVVSPKDADIAEQRFHEVVAQYKPAAIVFLSKLAFRWCKGQRELGIPVVATPHPGCAHWNRLCKQYEGKRGRDLLGDLVRRLWSSDAVKSSLAADR